MNKRILRSFDFRVLKIRSILIILFIICYSILILPLVRNFLDFYKFIFSLFIVLFLPGSLILSISNLKLNFLQYAGLSIALGVLISTFTYFALGLASCQQWIIFYIVIVLLTHISYLAFLKRKFIESISWTANGNKAIYLILISLVLVTTYIFSHSALLTREGMIFCGPHIDDSMIHLGIIHQLKIKIPPEDPLMSGSYFVYHFFNDSYHALISTVTGLSPLLLFFRYQFVFLVPLLCLISYLAILNLTKNKRVTYLFLLFLFFIGDFSFIPGVMKTLVNIDYLHQRWDNLFLSPLNSLFYENEGFLVSLIIFFAGFFFFTDYVNEDNRYSLFLTGLFWGFMIEYEIFLYMILMGSLIGGGIYSYLVKKKIKMLKILGVTVCFSLPFVILNLGIAYRCYGFASRGFIIFSPFHNFLKIFDAVISKVINTELGVFETIFSCVFILLFIIGSLGIRIFGIKVMIRYVKGMGKDIINDERVFLLLMGFISFMFGNILVYENYPSVTLINNWYFIIFIGLFAAEGLVEFLASKKYRMVWLAIFIIISIPSFVQYLAWGNRALHTIVKNEELRVMNYIKKNTPDDSVFITDNFDRMVFVGTSKKEIMHRGRNFALIGLTGRKVVIGGLAYKDQRNQAVSERIKDTNTLVSADDPEIARLILKKYDVDYILTHKEALDIEPYDIVRKIYDSKKFLVYEVVKDHL